LYPVVCEDRFDAQFCAHQTILKAIKGNKMRNVIVIDDEEVKISHHYWYEGSVYYRSSVNGGFIEFLMDGWWYPILNAA
jgi:hypothetical protein